MAERKTKSVHVGEFRKVKVKELGENTYPNLEPVGRDSNLIIYDDTLVVEGDLDLDLDELETGYAGIVVKGDLTVKGNIVNSDGDTGIYLYVKGTAIADNLLAGGAHITLNSANIKYFTVGHHNGGHLSVNKLNTEVILNSNHNTVIEDENDINISISTDTAPQGKIVIHSNDLAGFWAEHAILTDVVEYKEDKDEYEVGECKYDESYYYLKEDEFISHILNGEAQPLLEYVRKFTIEGKLRKDDLDLPEYILSYNPQIDVDWKGGVVIRVTVKTLEALDAFSKAIAPSKLKSLYSLSLRDFLLAEVPEAIQGLSHITELYITNAELVEVPEWIKRFSQLTVLDLSDNNITKIPEWIGSLSQLAVLELNNNSLSEVPDSIRSRFSVDAQGDEVQDQDDSSSSDLQFDSINARLDSILVGLEDTKASLVSRAKPLKRIIGMAVLVFTFAGTTIGFMVAAAVTSAELRQTMIILYYLSYAGGLASSMRLDWGLRFMLESIGVTRKRSPIIRYTLYASVSALIAVSLHWLVFWK